MVLHKVSACRDRTKQTETVLYSKHFATSQKCPYHVTFDLDLDLDLSTPWMQAGLGTIMCKFGSVPAICLREEAIFVKSQKSKVSISRDL